MRLDTIDDVLLRLDRIVDRAIHEGLREGYFAILYRAVTRRVKADIKNGRFEDGARMERFDVDFARLYFEAYDAHHAQRPIPECWRLAFAALPGDEPLILQHLLLGMNAHINLDLALAAVRTAPGNSLFELEADYMEINDLLAEMLDAIQEELDELNPLLRLVDWAGGRSDEAFFAFSLKTARDGAWRFAQRLAHLDEGAQRAAMAQRDRSVTRVGEAVIDPPPVMDLAARVARRFEGEDVSEALRVLASEEGSPPRKSVRPLLDARRLFM